MNFSAPIFSLLIGIVILLFGRRLFWLVVAAVGFAVGLELTPYLIHNPSPTLSLAVGIALGLLGALLAILLQKLAVAIVGFIVGGRIAVALVATFVVSHAQYGGVTFVIGGIIGALLLLGLFDWALIVFSSIEGARLIASSVRLPSTGLTILIIALTVFGILVQATMFGRRRTVAN